MLRRRVPTPAVGLLLFAPWTTSFSVRTGGHRTATTSSSSSRSAAACLTVRSPLAGTASLWAVHRLNSTRSMNTSSSTSFSRTGELQQDPNTLHTARHSYPGHHRSSSSNNSGTAAVSNAPDRAGGKRVRVTKVRRTVRRRRPVMSAAEPDHLEEDPTAISGSSGKKAAFSARPSSNEMRTPNAAGEEEEELEDAAGVSDARMEEQLGTDAPFEIGIEAAYPPSLAAELRGHTGPVRRNPSSGDDTLLSAAPAAMLPSLVVAAAAEDLEGLESGRPHEETECSMVEEEELKEFWEEVGEPENAASAASRSPTARPSSSQTTAGGGMGVPGSLTSAAPSSALSPTPFPLGLLSFEFENPLNLRLATLTRQAGKAFRAVAAHFPMKRGGSMDFELTFEDVASGAKLVCKLSEIKVLYFDWIAQFRSTFIALFVPTLHHPSAVLLQHAVLNGRPPRPTSTDSLPSKERVHDDADHLFFNVQKLQDTVVSKHEALRACVAASQQQGAQPTDGHTKKTTNSQLTDPTSAQGQVNVPLLTLTIMNTTPEEWQSFITAPLAGVPQDFLVSAFNFRPSAQTSISATLNKELLLAQLSAAARTLLFYHSSPSSSASLVSRRLAASGGTPLKDVPPDDFTTLSTAIAAASPLRSGATSLSAAAWKLVFVSAPGKTVTVPPPMQDLLTGQFVEPLTLSGQHVLYIIGTGNACLAFHQLPTARKGQHAISILLEDIESQLGLHRPHRVSLTAALTQAVESFSRRTWMGLMKVECGQLRGPMPPKSFYRLQRRTVQREVVPPFLEEVFGGGRNSAAGNSSGRPPVGSPLLHGGANVMMPGGQSSISSDVEAYMSKIFNQPDRLAREQSLRAELRRCRGYLIHLHTAAVTAARRSDNPFSNRNGIVEAWVQTWEELQGSELRPVTKHVRLSGGSRQSSSSSGSPPSFLYPDDVLPKDFPTAPSSDPDPRRHASKAILIAWDAKRVLLFLRSSRRLREFLFNGGRIWCAQYAQYLLRGFEPHHLATMEHTWAMCNDPSKPAPPKPLSPVGKLKVILEVQLQLAVYGRQLLSITKRMDGLLATTEMEGNGLRVVPQREVSRFAHQLTADREALEKVLQTKIRDFTKNMDHSVRDRINFRSPQDISTIIYGGGLCRHLSSRFVPVRPSKYPITSLFPHFVCYCTSTPIPAVYTQPETLLGAFHSGSKATQSGFPFTKRQVDDAIQAIQLCCRTHLPRHRGGAMQTLLANTAVVVLVCKASMGGLLERIAIFCPTVSSEEAATPDSGAPPHQSQVELRVRVAVDDITPLTTPPGKDPVMTVTQLKRAIREHAPLLRLHQSLEQQPLSRNIRPIRNLLLLTDCTHERLEVLVDTGVIQAIQETVLGRPSKAPAGGGAAPDGTGAALFAPPMERVCFADLTKAMPPTQTSSDSFEADFSDLNARPSASGFSAKESWEAHAKDHLSRGGMEGLFESLVSHCASWIATPRDPFRNSHPLPSVMPQGQHGQEQASTDGMLWMATPPTLHPVLRRFLQGRVASSSADAIERVTVFLAPYKQIDLSFFKALQQLRFTEKKLQLFDEGCLFRAVLPECHDRVHGEFCHCVTATGRLSSQAPNLQNIPREEDLRRLFVSRFGTEDGRMIEADYSQLEVVVLASLSGDPQMTEEIKRKVDFHCLRVSLMLKEPYESVEHKVKQLKDPHYIQLRQQAKTFSFQRQYGAGIATISTTTGLTEEEVDALITAEESHYAGLGTYYRLVENMVDAGNERLLRLRQLNPALPVHLSRVMLLTHPKNFFVVPTGSKFDLRKDRKSGPRLKNYPIQGLAGEIVQVMCGELVRHFYQKRNYNHKAFLVNTVHDCVWVDAHKDVAEEVKHDVAELLGSTQRRLSNIWPDVTFDVPFNAAIQSGPSLGELTSG